MNIYSTNGYSPTTYRQRAEPIPEYFSANLHKNLPNETPKKPESEYPYNTTSPQNKNLSNIFYKPLFPQPVETDITSTSSSRPLIVFKKTEGLNNPLIQSNSKTYDTNSFSHPKQNQFGQAPNRSGEDRLNDNNNRGIFNYPTSSDKQGTDRKDDNRSFVQPVMDVNIQGDRKAIPSLSSLLSNSSRDNPVQTRIKLDGHNDILSTIIERKGLSQNISPSSRNIFSKYSQEPPLSVEGRTDNDRGIEPKNSSMLLDKNKKESSSTLNGYQRNPLIKLQTKMSGYGSAVMNSSITNIEEKQPVSLEPKAEEAKGQTSLPASMVMGLAVNASSSEARGLVGLRNIGNTCFMNATLQALLNTPLFSAYFSRGDHMREMNQRNRGVAKAFEQLLGRVRAHTGPPSYSSESTIMVKRCIEEVNSMFAGYEQHDAQEFLKAILEGIHEDLNRVTQKPTYRELKAENQLPLQNISTEWFNYMLGRDNSVVTDLFAGQLLSRTTCSHCQHVSLAFDNFWDLSLSFTRGLSILDKCDLPRMIEHFLKEETLDDLYECQKCRKKRKFKKSFGIWRLPKILVLHLKRFHFGKFKKEKIRQSVVFPVQNLNLSSFVKESKDESVKDAKYSLFAIVNHMGNLDGGHYTAECMNLYNKKWYCFDDSNVKESQLIQEKDTEAQGENPYILFYVKTSCL